ncbi:FRIGIDA-like protein 4a [Ancistrocladus abbreviatus]
MGSIPDPGEFTPSQPVSFEEFQRQTSLMTSCTLLWKELSDHFTNLEQDLRKKSEALKHKFQALDNQTLESLKTLEKREVTIDGSVDLAVGKAEESKEVALTLLEERERVEGEGEVDDSEGLLIKLREFCLRMDHEGFWRFVTVRKKDLDVLRAKIALALADCVDPPRFVLEAISEVFPVDKRVEKSERLNDLGWACVLLLESLIPVVVDPVIGKERLLVTPRVRDRAKEIAETWKASLEERGGIENVKTPDVHTFLQHLVTFGIVKKGDVDLYRKLVVVSAWRKQMPKLAVSLGLGDKMPDMIEELISRGQQVDAVHFTYEVGLVDKFPPVPLLKAFLKDAKKAAAAISEDPNNTGRAAYLANRKEQSAIRAVLKCIEEYKLEAEFPPESLRKCLEQLEKTKIEKRKPAAVPANKRTRASNNGPMPPAKAGRSTNAYVSSFPATTTFVRSPSHVQYSVSVAPYPYDRAAAPDNYGRHSPPYAYSLAAAPPAIHGSYPGAPINYPVYGGYGSPSYPQVYY